MQKYAENKKKRAENKRKYDENKNVNLEKHDGKRNDEKNEQHRLHRPVALKTENGKPGTTSGSPRS